jgi:hypothetical protein
LPSVYELVSMTELDFFLVAISSIMYSPVCIGLALINFSLKFWKFKYILHPLPFYIASGEN